MPGTAFSTGSWTGYDEQSATNPTSALTDFTLLIDISRLSASWKAAIQSDGGDIRLTNGSNTQLPFDLIEFAYNAGAPTGWIRVKYTGTLATSGTQNVRVWAGYTGGTAVAYDATETYGKNNAYDSNTLGYWPDGCTTDRTASGNTGTPSGSGPASPGGATGKIGTATNYDGANDVSVLNSSLMPTGTGAKTSAGWVKLSDAGENGAFHFGSSSGSPNGGRWTVAIDNGAIRLRVNNGTTTYGSGIADGNWHFIALTIGASQQLQNIIGYKDGSSLGTSGSSTQAINVTTGDARFGDDPVTSGDVFFAGDLDDWSVHNAQRSAAWIAEEYAQGNDQATFWGTWAWTANGGGTTFARRVRNRFSRARIGGGLVG